MHLKPKLKRVGNKVAHPTLAVQDKSGNFIDRFLGRDRQNGTDVKVYSTMRIR